MFGNSKEEDDEIAELNKLKEIEELKDELKNENLKEFNSIIENDNIIEEQIEEIDINDSIKCLNSEHEDEFIGVNRKKKNSLLKRTASEPRLTKMESTNEMVENSIDLKTQYKTLNIEDKLNRKTFKDKFNTHKDSTDEQDDIDSPYNQIFFHNFENVLSDFIQNKIKLFK